MARICPQCGAPFGIREAKCAYCGYVDREYEQKLLKHGEKEAEQKVRYANALTEREKVQSEAERERMRLEREDVEKREKESRKQRKVIWIGFVVFILLNMFPIVFAILRVMFKIGL